jgi:predicted DNA-binding ribbon-helix-helix protein
MSPYPPRNVYPNGRKTSVRLEPIMWDALADIARHLGISVNALIGRIASECESNLGLTRSIRVYIVKFYRDRAAL